MTSSAAKTLPFILFALAALSMAGCSGAAVGLGTEAVGIVATDPSAPPPADTADQIAPHENWCYETLGYPECYPHPQKTDPDRLINVDPANRYPLTPRAYHDAEVEDQ